MYEDKQDDKTEVITTKNIKNDIAKEALCIPKQISTDVTSKDDKSISEDVVQDSPMSVDKSLVSTMPSRQISHRQEREIFFEMPEYRDSIHKYLRQAEVNI